MNSPMIIAYFRIPGRVMRDDPSAQRDAQGASRYDTCIFIHQSPCRAPSVSHLPCTRDDDVIPSPYGSGPSTTSIVDGSCLIWSWRSAILPAIGGVRVRKPASPRLLTGLGYQRVPAADATRLYISCPLGRRLTWERSICFSCRFIGDL